jgi:hypothetical protein
LGGLGPCVAGQEERLLTRAPRIEERDDSADVLAQMVWSTEYIDAPVCRHRSTDYSDPNDAGADACLHAAEQRSRWVGYPARQRVDAGG